MLKARAALAAALSVALVLGAGACSPRMPSVPAGTGDAHEAAPTTRALAGSLWSGSANQAISPGGKYLLARQYYGRSEKMLLVPIAHDGDVIVLWEVPDISVGEDLVSSRPIGWLSADRCLFAVCGPWAKEAHAGTRGISVLEARLAAIAGGSPGAKVRELAFLPLSSGRIDSTALVEESGGEVLIHAWNTLWAVSLSTKTVRTVMSGPEMLQSEGLTLPSASPDHSLWVLRGKEGLSVVDATTGQSTLAFRTGDSFSFEPVWSPDGRYVAAYTAPRRDGVAGRSADLSWEDYEVFPSEPGFVPMAERITVADRDGRVVREVNVENEALSNFVWSADSSHLLFLTCTYHTEMGMSPHDHSKQVLVPVVAFHEVRATPVQGEGTVPVADLKDIRTDGDRFHVQPISAVGSGNGLLLQVWSDRGAAVWYVDSSTSPVRVAEGEIRGFGVCPDLRRPALGLIVNESKAELWMLAPGEFRAVSEFASGFVDLVGYSDDLVAVFEGNVFEPDGALRVFKGVSRW